MFLVMFNECYNQILMNVSKETAGYACHASFSPVHDTAFMGYLMQNIVHTLYK